jgi:hypothetical protein
MNVFKWLFTLPPDPIDLFELNKQVLIEGAERKLRDELAGKAMQALIQDYGFDEGAKAAYSWADAMLAEREKTND